MSTSTIYVLYVHCMYMCIVVWKWSTTHTCTLTCTTHTHDLHLHSHTLTHVYLQYMHILTRMLMCSQWCSVPATKTRTKLVLSKQVVLPRRPAGEPRRSGRGRGRGDSEGTGRGMWGRGAAGTALPHPH